MKKRIFAFLMAVIMLVSVVPTDAYARSGGNGGQGGNGGRPGSSTPSTNLGWEYADVTPTYDSSGNFSGYDLAEAETHLGQFVTVTYSGDLVNDADSDGKWDEGQTERQDGIISADSSETVTITCAPGYYIEWVVLACGNNSDDDPFSCQTVATDEGIGWQNTIATFTRVTLSMSDLRSHANHGSGDDAYYLMIEIKLLPSTVYVGYDSGSFTKADGTTYTVQSIPVDETGTLSDGATQVSTYRTYPTWKYSQTSPTHSALGISAAAEAEANAQGYSFAGWHLTYYASYDEDTNAFSGDSAIGGTNLPKGSNVTLTIHAELVAIWQPMDTISVSKVWNDADNQDGIRPTSVEVHLLRNGVHNGNPVTLSADNNWSATWTVPSKDQNGNAIAWTVEEVVPSGYTVAVSGDAENGFVVTNSHVADRISAQVQKVWNDDNNRDGIRPYGVQVQLYKNGEAVTSYTDANGNEISGTATLTEDTSWSHQWLDLEKNKSGAVGQANEYTVQEIGYVDEDGNAVANPGYTASQSTDADTGVLLITNTHTSATMDIPVEKVWDDSDNRDGKRPASVTVTLTANGVATDKSLVLNEENEWKGIFEGVYVNANGTPIHYSVVENEVAGYAVAVSGSASTGFVVTNTHTPETTSVPVTKVWADGNDQDGIRPTGITVQLYADGVAVEGMTLALDATMDWQGSFDNLPKYRDGKVGELIVYTVQETAVPEGYTASYNGTTVTNTHTPDEIVVNVVKEWDDKNNYDGIRSHAVVVTLHINGEPAGNFLKENYGIEIQESLTLTAKDSWKGAWTGLPRFHNGQRISYSVIETGYIQNSGEAVQNGVPVGYTVDHTYTGEDTKEHTATVINIHEPVGTDLNVQKVWDDDDNRAGLRPGSIEVELYADGVATGEKRTLSAANEWDGTFTGLRVYNGDKKVAYTVVETALDSELGYGAPAYDLDETLRVITVTNKREDEKVSVTVSKKWTDENNQDNIRPDSVTVTLYANGIDAGVSKTLDASNGWTATFDNLYKHYNGEEVLYTVVETAVPGYTAEYNKTTDANGNVTIEVENIHTPEVISVPVTKVWQDDNDRDGIRPTEITVTLQKKDGENWVDVADADGKVVTLTLTDENNWQGSFDNLPKNLAGAVGQKIEYRVTEAAVSGYNLNENGEAQAVIASAVDGKVTITNVREVEKTSIKVTKEWEDEENQDRVRPSEITVYLYANGNLLEDKTVTLKPNTDGVWSHEWTDLYKYEEGKEINYTVYEETLGDGYSATIERIDDNTVKITNTRNVNKTTFTVQKIWDDANNQDNVRYDGVVVQLYADGTAFGAPVTLTADGHWLYTWTDLNVNKVGSENSIVYTVEELNYVTVDDQGNKTEVALAETYYAEGTPTLDPHTGITTITNKHTVEKTSTTVKKNWNDAEDQDRIRPASVTLQLYKNGQPVTSYTYIDSEGNEQVVPGIVTLNADNEWQATFIELDVHHGIGIDNVYTVVEIGHTDLNDQGKEVYTETVPEGYTAAVGSADNGYTVTNTHEVEKVSIPVSKVWDDANDQDGKRPVSITVQLYAGGVAVEGRTLTLSASNNWQGSFDGLDKNQDGTAIVYTVGEVGHTDLNNQGQEVYSETIPEGYEATVDGTTITNTHVPETTSIKASKVWNDSNNQDGKRPESITLHLLSNGDHMNDKDTTDKDFTIVLDGEVDENGEIEPWVAEWKDLPMYEEAKVVNYTVFEAPIEPAADDTSGKKYSATYSRDENGNIVVTNTRSADKTTYTVQKVWNDANNQDNLRPYGVVVELLKKASGDEDYVSTNKQYTLTADMNWRYTWADLDLNSDGDPIDYFVAEVGYYETKSDADSGSNMKSGEVPGYTTVSSEDTNTGIGVITNTHEVLKTKVTVKKVWSDKDDQDGKRPESVTVQLYANGVVMTGKTAVLDSENNWTAVFSDLDVHHGIGVDNVYTVVEIGYTDKEDNAKSGVPEGYTVTYPTETDTDGTLIINVTNTHTPEVVSIPVMKVWADANDQDGIRPASVTVTLYADGTAVNTLELSADGNWRGSFENMPKYKAGAVGQEIVYTVGEADEDIPEGYTPTVDGNTITNTHTPAVTAVKAIKVWNDAEDQDGKRPDSIKLHLLANGKHTEKTATVSADADGNWIYVWTDLPKYEDAKEINYTVYEEVTEQMSNDGYTVSYDREGNEIKITNTRAVEKTSFTVQKVWNDANNQDNVRYDGVVVGLYVDETQVGTATLTAENHWRHIWTGLDKNANGQPVTYTVRELNYVEYVQENGETKTVEVALDEEHYTEPKDGLGTLNTTTGITTITNTHEVQKIDVEVTKAWADANDQDGIRPYAVRVELYRNGQATEQTVVLNGNNEWTDKFTGLDVHHGIGVDNVYTVVETGYLMTEDGEWQNGIAPGYTAEVTGTAADGYTVTNSHTPETISVPVAKTWNDNNDQDGIRPDFIVVQLYAGDNAVDGKTLTLSASNNWKDSFDNLPKYAEGEEIVYTVVEVVPVLDDGGNVVTDSEGNPTYEPGAPEGYTPGYSGTTVINTHTPETVNLSVQKVWDDANNQDGKRPFAVVVTLYANGQLAENVLNDYPNLVYEESLTLSEEYGWQGIWADLPRFHNGQRISYTVVETGYIQKDGDKVTSGLPEGYTVTHSYGTDNAGKPFATVTNSYTPELTDLNVQKIWDDEDNRAGLRPDSITVTLTKQNSEGEWEVVVDANNNPITAELNPANEWDYTFIGMPKYANGVEIVYGVEETPLDDTLGYEKAKYDYDRGTRIVTITNTREAERVSVTVSKTWDDKDNQDGKRPGSVTVTLFANGIATSETRTLTGDNWTATFDNLYKHYKGGEVLYTVVETAVPGYTAEYNKTTDANGITIEVKNIHTPEVISIPVTKVWNDNSNQDGIRPDSVTVTLIANGTSTGKTAELTIDNNWTDSQTFVGLPKYEGGEEIVYTVAEGAVEGYTMTADTTESGITVTNTHEPEKTEVTVTKVWNDGNDQDGIRPDSVKVHLLANGEHTGKTVELTEDMGWTYTWEPLDKFAAGREIVYTVYEEIKTESVQSAENSRAITDYMPSYAHDPQDPNKITITNSYTPATTTVTVLKVWDDGADRDGLRPESIQAELYADGVATGKILTLNEANGWSSAWTGVAKYRDRGQEIVYSVAEVSIPSGYEAKVVQDTEIQAGLFIITNSHTPAITGVGVNKIWNDENDNDGKRPDGIIVQLYANGSAVEGARVELNVLNNWSHVWHNSNGQPLYVFDKGEEVSYYVDEVGYVIDGEEYEDLPEGYAKTSSTKDYSTSITNTRETEKINVSVEKIWQDSDNNDGIRPATVSITLYRNGEALETVELNAENDWTHTWTKLYKYVAGVEAEYTVKEADVAGYTTDYVSVERVDGGIHWAVTNTHEAATKDVMVSKVWKDNNDAEDYRPESVKVRLYKNGKAYGDVITLSAGNGWKCPLTLPVYENGKEIVWTIAEIKIPKYYSATYNQKTLTVTNTIQSKEIPKTGDDSNLLIWTGMMLLSCAGAAAVLMSDRKRRPGKSK